MTADVTQSEQYLQGRSAWACFRQPPAFVIKIFHYRVVFFFFYACRLNACGYPAVYYDISCKDKWIKWLFKQNIIEGDCFRSILSTYKAKDCTVKNTQNKNFQKMFHPKNIKRFRDVSLFKRRQKLFQIRQNF